MRTKTVELFCETFIQRFFSDKISVQKFAFLSEIISEPACQSLG